ncbi:MAG TPA: hypothetical protein DD381_06370 [Lentisphaeria bacterium]|nr:MAG: hypothetical protein A2X47_13410 [Lentisphaerae bacterium GWF2_38_69]HBM15950.1 hypothetical protein [Lentisphaeria bacterium]
MRYLKFFHIVSGVLCISLLLNAQDSNSGLLNIREVLKKAEKCSLETYPNSDEVLVDDYIRTTYLTDGTGEILDDTVIKILTDKGREDYKVLGFYYVLPYSRVEIKKLEVIKADGRIIPVDIKTNAKEMIDDSQMFANIYNPNDKILKVTIPDLETTDCIRYLTCEKMLKPIIPDEFFDRELLESTSPVVHFKYEIIAPKEKPIVKMAVLDKVSDTVSSYVDKDGDNIRYVWEVKDVPRMFPEPNMPPIQSVVQRVLTSTINSWEDVSKWYWNLCSSHINATTPEMEKKVKELIHGKADDIDKIKAIYYFVAQEIRYMGVTTEKDAPGFEPHDVSLTFNNRYGVCRDKAALLVAMLRIAGYKAYPVLIMVGSKLDNEVPVPYFNHAVSCVELSNGKVIFMDSTNESSKDIFPSYLCNRSYLIAKPDGVTLRTTPIVPATENLVEISTDGTINDNGVIDAESYIKFEGINDSMYRGHFTRLSSEEKRIFFEKVLRKDIPSAELFYYSISPENLFDMSKPLSVKMRYTAKNSIVNGEGIKSLSLPWLGNCIGIVNYIVGQTGLTERKYPLVTEIACGYREKINLILPEEIKLDSIPEFKNIESETLVYERTIKNSDRKIDASSEFLIKSVEFSPLQYLTLKKDLQTIEVNDKMRLLASVSEDKKAVSKTAIPQEKESDAKILLQNVDVTLNNDGSTLEKHKVKTKILTYNGKKDNSEIKITYNPIWENVKILNARVISASGKIQKIDTSEVNIMDSSWTASAPRYPAEKIMVISLPGVEVGSTIDLEYEATTKNKPFYSGIFVFRSKYPIEKYEVKLNISKERNLHFLDIEKKNADAISEEISENNEFTSYCWTALNQSPVVEEESFPPVWTFLPTVIVSEGNWKDYTEALLERFNELLKDNNMVSELTEKIIESKSSEKEKILSIRDFIEKNINNSGPAFTDLPLSCVSKPDVTLKDGYGNNADRALLYTAMLNSAGFKTQFVLASGLPYLEQLLSPVYICPQRELFSGILVRIKNSDDNYIYLNDTDQYSSYGSVSHEGDAGILFGDAAPIKIEPLKEEKTYLEMIINTSISTDGSAEISITKKFYGNNFGDNNKAISLLTPEDRARFYKELIANISQSAVSVSDLQYNFKSYPGIETFKVKIPDYCVKDGNYMYFSLYTGNSRIFTIGAREKFYPYYIDSEINLKLANTITFPENMQSVLIKPSSCNFMVPGSAGSVFISSMAAGKNSKTYYDVIEYKLKSAIIPPEEYSRIVDIQDYLSSEQNSMFLIKLK